MRNKKYFGWLCLVVILCNFIVLPWPAAGESGSELPYKGQRELFDSDLLIQESPSGTYPPGRTLDEDDFFVEEQDREVRLWEPTGERVRPIEISLPEFPESNPSSRSRGTCTVTSTADSGAGTLRECLANAVAGDTITFNPTNFPPAAPQTINLANNLPGIYDNNVIVDASNAGVIINGSGIPGDAFGLVIWGAQGVTIRGLQILNFTLGILIGNGASYNTIGGDRAVGSGPLGQGNRISGNSEVGVQLQSVGTSNNSIRGNLIGTDLSGNAAVGNGYEGVFIGFGASQNVIGGSHSPGACDGACNLISGNQVGIHIEGAETHGNQVLGNFIGTNLAGNSANPNTDTGLIIWGAPENLIGGAHNPGVCDGPCNLISGNIEEGIVIYGIGSNENKVQGNFIGTNITGDSPLPNNNGLVIAVGAKNNQVGGTGMGEGNLVSGNVNYGIWISYEDTTDNQVLGNRIGTDITGFAAVPNYQGIHITSSPGNQIGGAAAGTGNLISGNDYYAIVLFDVGAPGNSIAGNMIGTNLNRTAALPNYFGIALYGGGSHLIGGTTFGAGNLISGNTVFGIIVEGSSSNQLHGNTIGVDQSGNVAIPNQIGVLIGFGASNNLIGGSNTGMGNLISGNTEAGIKIQNQDSIGNQVLGNRIGTNRGGTSALPNKYGIVVMSARETTIGGADLGTPWVCDGPCNLISGNLEVGIQNLGIGAGDISSPGSIDQANQVLGNFIGTDLSGAFAIPNRFGVDLALQAGNNRVGGSSTLGEGNLISGNQFDGVLIRDMWADGNQVSGNRIGTRADGNTALPNGETGLQLQGGASGNLIGGDGAGMGNLISGNTHFGLWLVDAGTTNNQVLGNRIGTNAAGTSALPNLGGIGLVLLASGTDVQGNVISGNTWHGVEIAESTGNQFSDNRIGVAVDGLSQLPNGQSGFFLYKAPHNAIGPGNTIAHNFYGVSVLEPESIGNTITRNSIYGNKITQIDFFNMLVPLAPTLMGWNAATMTVTGMACAGCQVEVFANPTSTPAGHTYLGTATAAGDGSFSLVIGAGHIYLAATATDAEGTTSEFSNVFQIGVDLFRIYLPLTLK